MKALVDRDCVTLLYYQLSCCSPLLHSSAISISHSSIWERRVVKRLSFARDLDADTHTMMQINRKLMRSTSTTGPTIAGMMTTRFSGSAAAWYVSVPTVKFRFVPIITWIKMRRWFDCHQMNPQPAKPYMYSLSQLIQTHLQVVGLVGSRQSTKSKCF